MFTEVEKNPELSVIVEGKKDKEVLKAFGFKKIIDISGQALEDVLEKVLYLKTKEVGVLTDFDREGEDMASQLNFIFSHHKIRVNFALRNKFRSLKIHQVEELNSITRLMEDDYNGEISSIYGKIFSRSRVLGRRNSGKTRCNRSHIRSDRGLAGSRA
jgi:5S rRNA maturation endonuclease (ribonuclease M5)